MGDNVGQRVQTSSYKMNKFQGFNVQPIINNTIVHAGKDYEGRALMFSL